MVSARVARRTAVGRLLVVTLPAVVALAGCASVEPDAVSDPPSTTPGPTTGTPLGDGPPSGVLTTPVARPRSFTLVASGDVLVHDGVRAQARRDAEVTGGGFDFLPTLAGTTGLVRDADLALCHLEVPLGGAEGPFRGYPDFSAPPQVASALARQGYDSCSTASNHSLDGGVTGVRSTLDALDAAGVRHAGTARSAAEASSPTLLRAGDVEVAQLSYTYGFNGRGVPADRPWLANRIDADRIAADARAARRAGADVVVVSMHWGTELRHDPDPAQASLARRLLGSPDVDLVVGHHAHVVQPLERVGDKWVAYGLGNLVAAKSHNYAGGATREGIIPRFTFTETAPGRFRVTKVEVFPTYVDASQGLRVRDVAQELARPDLTTPERARLRQAYDRTREVVLRRGADAAGLVVAPVPG